MGLEAAACMHRLRTGRTRSPPPLAYGSPLSAAHSCSADAVPAAGSAGSPLPSSASTPTSIPTSTSPTPSTAPHLVQAAQQVVQQLLLTAARRRALCSLALALARHHRRQPLLRQLPAQLHVH